MANILCIEPDDRLARVYQKLLSHQGHTVIAAASAQAAVHAAEKMTIDVVVLELDIPKHNGIAFLHEFRSYTEWLTIPVIVHSSSRSLIRNRNRAFWEELGVVSVLYKPDTSLQDLVTSVERIAA